LLFQPTEAARLWGTQAYFESEEALAEELDACGYTGPSEFKSEEERAAHLMVLQAEAEEWAQVGL
jgi:hypothetical protein